MAHVLAGKVASKRMLVDTGKLVKAFYSQRPQGPVAFGTSGHRGSSLNGTFNEQHIVATAQAICDYRKARKINGPLYLGKDTHALSGPAFVTAREVLVANEVEVFIDEKLGYTPTPVISHAILRHNRRRRRGLADGIVITPSHNPPEDGGFKYNPPHGGPADTAITKWIEKRANEILRGNNTEVKRTASEGALKDSSTVLYDYITPYVDDLRYVIEFSALSPSGIRIGADPMGGSGVEYWGRIAEKYRLNIEVVNPDVDPTFSFMTVDHDGKIRMDCSSQYAMASLISLKDEYDIAFGNDTDFDRHGIVTPSVGLMNPNDYLSVAIWYLFDKCEWDKKVAVGKTLVSSSMIDRVAASLNRRVVEVPVGFKWFVNGLHDGSYGFAGEESAGASFLRGDGTVWTTDKDGIILNLLAAEIIAETGRDPGELYQELTKKFGEPVYKRIDAPATPEQKAVLKKLSPQDVKANSLAGERIIVILTNAPGNNEPIGGLKVVTKNGWFAARPSGTENVYKIYAESFKGEDHLNQIIAEAQEIVNAALRQ